MSPYRPDHILPTKNGSWRVVSEGSTHEWATSLLIVRTDRIVTARKGRVATGYTGFPAYSQVLLRQRIHETLGPFLLLLLEHFTQAIRSFLADSHGRP